MAWAGAKTDQAAGITTSTIPGAPEWRNIPKPVSPVASCRRGLAARTGVARPNIAETRDRTNAMGGFITWFLCRFRCLAPSGQRTQDGSFQSWRKPVPPEGSSYRSYDCQRGIEMDASRQKRHSMAILNLACQQSVFAKSLRLPFSDGQFIQPRK